MKKYAYLIFGILIIVAVGCKKKDTSKPMIFLNGDADPYRVVVGTWFQDPGLTATDNVDGKEIVSKVTLTHDVPGLPSDASTITELEGFLSRTGDFTITYSLTDEAGNTTSVTRNVQVYNEAEKYAIEYYYSKTSNGVISTDVPLSQGVMMSLGYDSKENWRIIFPKLSNISGLRVYGDITKNDTDPNNVKYEIDIPYQEITVGSYEYHVQGNSGMVTDTLFYTLEIDYRIDRIGSSTATDDVVEKYERI